MSIRIDDGNNIIKETPVNQSKAPAEDKTSEILQNKLNKYNNESKEELSIYKEIFEDNIKKINIEILKMQKNNEKQERIEEKKAELKQIQQELQLIKQALERNNPPAQKFNHKG